jgi:hypothetical protein
MTIHRHPPALAVRAAVTAVLLAAPALTAGPAAAAPDPATTPKSATRAAATPATATGGAPGVTITQVSQECLRRRLPWRPRSIWLRRVTVQASSGRPGVPANVVFGYNFNSADGSYQGPTAAAGTGQFTATASTTAVSFVIPASTTYPWLGTSADAQWSDGTPSSVALTYTRLTPCRWPVLDPSRWQAAAGVRMR